MLDLTSKYAGADWTEQQQVLSQTLPNFSNLATFSNCSKNLQNVIQIALKWQFFFFSKKKMLELHSPGPHTCHFVQNVIMFKTLSCSKCQPNSV